MVINTGNQTEENLEKTEGNKKADILQFKKDFVRESLIEKSGQDKNDFIFDIMTNDSFSTAPNIESDLRDFKAKSINQEKYPNLKIEDIDIIELRAWVEKEFLSLKNSRENFKAKVLLDYDITDKKYDSDIGKKIEELKLSDLKRLLGSDKKLTEYIKKDLNLDLIKRDHFKVFNKISETEIRKRILNLDNTQKSEVQEIINRLSSTNKITDIDIRTLFSCNIIKTKEEKAEFIYTYIPFITLKEAVDLGLLENTKAKKIYKNVSEKIAKSEGLDSATTTELVKNPKLENIKIATKEYFNKIEEFDKLASEIGFKMIDEDLESMRKETEENLKARGPQNLYELGVSLSQTVGEKVNNVEKFKEGNYIEFSSKNTEGNIEKSYIKVKKDYENEKEFAFYRVSAEANVVNLNGDGVERKISYVEFLDTQKKSEKNLDFFTLKEMKEKVHAGELEVSDFEGISSNEINNNLEKKKEIQGNFIKNLEEEIKVLEENKAKGEKINETELQNKKDKLLELSSGNASSESLSEFENLRLLVEKIDKIDEKGKDIVGEDGSKGLFKGLVFKTKEGQYYSIDGISDGIINVVHTCDKSLISPLSFGNFYETFKKEGCKRVEAFQDMGDLIKKGTKENKLGWGDFKNKWENHEFKNGKLIAKDVEDGDEKGDREVDYLISDKKDEIIKILSTDGGMVEIQRGTRKAYTDMPEEDAEKLGAKNQDIYKKYKGEVLFIKGAQTEKISLSELQDYIDDLELYPYWQTGKNIKTKTEKNAQTDFRGNIFSKIFSLWSVSEIVKGGNVFIESFKETLKKGNEIHAAEMALKLGKLLPGDLKEDLLTKVEGAKKEEMDKEVEALGKVDSPIAIARILKWLKNKDCPEHKKEAGMLFMLEKYGHLSAKAKELYAYRGKRLWYEAFGGRVNDEFFLTQKKKAEEGNVSFSEEFLMLHFLKAQCKSEGYNGIRRRTRLHKEYEALWSKGVQAEFEKGHEDGSKKRTAETCVFEGMLELTGGTTSNAIGWFKKAIEIGGSLEEMSEGFFCILYGGVFNNLDEKTFKLIKDLWDGNGLGIILARFASKTHEANLFNDTVLYLSESIEEADSSYNGIAKEARDIYNKVKSGKKTDGEMIKQTQMFWKKYGKVLSRSLHMLNTNDTEHGKTDKIIFLEKDKPGKKGETFTKYFETVKAYTEIEHALNSEILNDGLLQFGTSGLSVKEFAKRYLGMHTNRTFKDTKTGPNIWTEIENDFTSINKKTFKGDKGSVEDIQAKKKYLHYTLKELIAGIRTATGADFLSNYNSPTLDIGRFFNSIGLNVLKYVETDAVAPDVADNMLNKAVDSILHGNLDSTNKDFVDPFTIKNPIKDKTSDILGSN